MKVKNFRLWNRDPFYFFQWRVRLLFFDRRFKNPAELNRFPSDRSPNAAVKDGFERAGKEAKRRRSSRFAARLNRPLLKKDFDGANKAGLSTAAAARTAAPESGRALVAAGNRLPVKPSPVVWPPLGGPK